MRPSISRLLVALFAAPLTLVSSAALAAPGPEACNNVALASGGTCEFEVSGGCVADCTPLNLVAACDGHCTASASVECTGGCVASCETQCNVNPGSFDCEGSCTESCDASCMTSCSDSACQAQCHASCDNRCNIKCATTLPSATCEAKCQASCDANCVVQANVDCAVKCTTDLEGGCKVKCGETQGALFCNGQYVDIVGSVQDCTDYLKSRGLSVGITTECGANGCDVTTTVGCSAAPAVGAIDERYGVGAVAGLMVGLGLFVSRRRRRA